MEKIEERINQLEEELRKTPYHKGTEHHLGLVKAKIAKLKKELEEKEAKKGGLGYGVKKSGQASCVLIGPPSAGKSTLLNSLTRAKSKVGSYGFTTLEAIPGIMEFQGAQIQILDLPGLVKGAAQGKGRGRKILSLARATDLIILMTDVDRIGWLEKMKKELYQAGVRLNSRPAKIKIKKTARGGIKIIDPFNCFEKKTIFDLAQEFGLKNGEIIFQEKVNSLDQLIDFLAGNRAYLPSIEVINKIDLKKPGSRKEVLISLKKKVGLEELKKEIWEKLGLIRIYLKKTRASEPDFNQPLILKKGALAAEAIEKVSSDLKEEINQVLAWGPGTKFPGQIIPLNHFLEDKTILFFVKK